MCLSKLEKFSPFTRMLVGAVLGTICGIILGLAFALLIAYLTNVIHTISIGDLGKGDYPLSGFPGEDYNFVGFVGMGFGAMIGSILGAVYINKK